MKTTKDLSNSFSINALPAAQIRSSGASAPWLELLPAFGAILEIAAVVWLISLVMHTGSIAPESATASAPAMEAITGQAMASVE